MLIPSNPPVHKRARGRESAHNIPYMQANAASLLNLPKADFVTTIFYHNNDDNAKEFKSRAHTHTKRSMRIIVILCIEGDK